MAEDQATQYGISLLGLVHSWFNFSPNKNMLMLAALAIILFLPLPTSLKQYQEINFRLSFFPLRCSSGSLSLIIAQSLLRI